MPPSLAAIGAGGALISVLVAVHFADLIRTVIGAVILVAAAVALYPRALASLVTTVLARLALPWFIKA